jgi:hypothetical protein
VCFSSLCGNGGSREGGGKVIKDVEEITITVERVDEVPRTEFVGFFDRPFSGSETDNG